MYQRLLFVNSKHCSVDWNERRRLLGLRVNARGKVDTVKVVSLNRCRPCTVIKWKRPPAVEINSFGSCPNS